MTQAADTEAAAGDGVSVKVAADGREAVAARLFETTMEHKATLAARDEAQTELRAARRSLAAEREAMSLALMELARERDAALERSEAARAERDAAVAAAAHTADSAQRVAAELMAVMRQRDALAAELWSRSTVMGRSSLRQRVVGLSQKRKSGT